MAVTQTRKQYVARWLYHWLYDSGLDGYFPDPNEAMLEETLTEEKVDELLVGYFSTNRETSDGKSS